MNYPIIGLFALAFTFGSVASNAIASEPPTIVLASDAKYAPAPKPYPDGAQIAVLSGNPEKAGSQYAVRLKLPDGAVIVPHTHGDRENVTVISGTLLVGVGTSFDASKMLALTAGSHASIPPGLPHFAKAKGLTVVQIDGVGPTSTTAIQ